MANGLLTDVIQYLRRLAIPEEAARLTDAALLDGFVVRRDQRAFEALLQRHGPMVLGVCRGILRVPSDVEDAFQATFLVLVRRAGSIRKRELLANWLYGVAYRVATRLRTQECRRSAQTIAEVDMGNLAQRGATSEPDLGSVIHEELMRLPASYRQPIILCYMEGHSQADAARRLGWTVGRVRGRLERARDRLRNRLARRGLGVSGGLFAAILSRGEVPVPVPVALMDSTCRAALAVGAGTAAAGGVSVKAIALTQRVLQTMWMDKLKLTALLIMTGLFTLGTGFAAYRSLAAEQIAADNEAPAKPPTETARPGPEETPVQASREPKPDTMPLTVRGKATDDSGKRVRGATIYVAALGGPTYPAAVVGTAKTDDQGRYTIDCNAPFFRPRNLPPQGQFQVFGTAPGFGFTWCRREIFFAMPRDPNQPTEARPIFQGDEPTMDLVFGPGAMLRGRIAGELDQPLAGVKITIRCCGRLRLGRGEDQFSSPDSGWGINLAPASLHTATTDKEGRFRLEGLATETCCVLDVRHPDFAPVELYAATMERPLPEEIPPGAAPAPGKKNRVWTGYINLKLAAARTVTVQTVSADSGKSAPGMAVRAYQSGPTRSHAYGVTDAGGKVSLRLPPGEFDIDVDPRDAAFLPAKARLAVKKAGAEPIRVEVSPACQLTLEAVDADGGKGIPNVAFKFEEADKPGQWQRVQPAPLLYDDARTDASGKLRVIVRPGKRRYSATPLGAVQFGYELPKGYRLVKEDTGPIEMHAGKAVNLRFEFRKD